MIIRLESVRRVDSGKSVIKKMIVLSNLVNAIVSSKQTLGVVDEVFNFKIGGIVYRFVYLAEVSDRYSLTKIFGWIHHHFARFVYNPNAYIFWLGKVFFFFFSSAGEVQECQEFWWECVNCEDDDFWSYCEISEIGLCVEILNLLMFLFLIDLSFLSP